MNIKDRVTISWFQETDIRLLVMVKYLLLRMTKVLRGELVSHFMLCEARREWLDFFSQWTEEF